MKILSGMRPTGKLHLGHYYGVLKNWLKFQNEAKCNFFVADLHALSTSYEDKINLKNLGLELIKDWLCSGVDPNKANIFIQSEIKEHSELFVILSMITPVSWLERNPTYKDQIQNLKNKDISSVGFLSYPILQAVDIILYDTELVPIGEDQKPHLELTREIVRRFNSLYKTNILKEPKEILTKTPKLIGLDGRKMSKSYNNSIYLSDDKEIIWGKIKGAKTDPSRIRLKDPGDPNKCLIFDLHKLQTSNDTIKEIEESCKTAKIGCIDCKKVCLESLDKILKPIRERKTLIKDDFIKDIINEGNKKAQKEASLKMNLIKEIVLELKYIS